MKTIRYIGITLLTVLMSVGFSACSSSDDDNSDGSSSASIEGTWHPKSQIWYKWDKENNAPDYSKSYTLNDDAETWIFTKNGDNYIWRYIYTEKGGGETEEIKELIRNQENDYKVKGRSYSSRVVFKTVKTNSIELEYWDGYYREGGTSEYGIVNLVK